MGDASGVAQLVQAMAGFGGSSGPGDDADIAAFATDASEQSLLTTPQSA
jgi:hypothetical protein